MAHHDTNAKCRLGEQSNIMHSRDPNRSSPDLKRTGAFIDREKGAGEKRSKPEFPSGPVRVDKDEIHMLPGTLVTYAKAGMSAMELGQVLHEAAYDNDEPLGHLVTALVDEGRPYAEIALTVFRWLDLRDDAGGKLFVALKLGDTELCPMPGPYVREI
ncbi:hypothetical protein BDW42DRAFT_192388 [Aspergillus taichungensis]|uniref:Uncharacterized protein n=1 Tax=Aspergillus taichungensis TaxID=482145 RepID=A0A2J5I0W0_9EURO|nr:hypothetical protein BDW42DRAFT_192388 [Aspergillus taichungensis]